MKTIEESIEVEVPVSTAYNQWTQFESFPQFMDGIERVEQKDDTRLHWIAEVGGAVSADEKLAVLADWVAAVGGRLVGQEAVLLELPRKLAALELRRMLRQAGIEVRDVGPDCRDAWSGERRLLCLQDAHK